jgi:hypothetical protein
MSLQQDKEKLLDMADTLRYVGWSLAATLRFLVWVYLPHKKVGSTGAGA